MERVVAALERRSRFNDADVGAVAQAVLHDLVQPTA